MLLLSDIRYATRSLIRRPGFALLAIATLGLGIGANTAIFSALWRINYAQLPFETAERLVSLNRTREGEGFFLSPTPALVEAWRKDATQLEQVTMAVRQELTLTGRGQPVALQGARISSTLPEMLREEPLLGRTFTEAEAQERAPVVVLSEDLWRTHFGGTADVLGTSVRLGGEQYTVIGVMRERFGRYSAPFPAEDFWMPYRYSEEDHYGSALALIREGADLEAVSAELEAIAAGIPAATPAGSWNYRAVRVEDMVGQGLRERLPILLGAVALVLLIACANVAGLMIVRLNARRREIAIRAALGARHRRILAGLAVEQVLLALGAGVIGVLLAAWGISFLPNITPEAMRLLDTLALDPAVLLFAGGLLLASTLLAGVVPAWTVLRSDLADSLRSGGDRVTSGTRARSILVSGQIALSVVLLVGAALLIRSFGALSARDLGFDRENMLVATISLPEDRYPVDAKGALFEQVLDGVRSIPGVTEAAVGGGTPPNMGLLFGTLQVEGSTASTDGISYLGGTSAAPGFLPALGVRFIGGRDFTEADRDMNAVIVNRRFVEHFWPGENGVGRRMKLVSQPDAPWIEIVGVIEDIRGASHSSTDDDLQVFYPIEWSYPEHALLLRTDGRDPLELVPAIRQVIARIDSELPLKQVATMEAQLADSIARERFSMVLLSIFAGLALVLSVVGLYGLVAYTVQQRVREIGIRVALGATSASVRSLFMAHGMRLVVAGLVLGIAGGVVAVRVLRSMVFGVAVYDGLSFAIAVTVIAASALLASWLPARRAARVDPLRVLREE